MSETTRMLVIDDDALAAKAIKAMLLCEPGRDVMVAHSGKDGIALAKKHKPHLIVLDVAMPEMDGVMVLQSLKENPGTQMIPVIMLTGLNDEQIIAKTMYWYAEHYLLKPVQRCKLEEVVGRVLSSRKRA